MPRLLAFAAAAALIAAPGAAGACETGPSDIYFEPGSARLTPRQRDEIRNQAFILGILGEGARIRLTAHSDTVGDGWENLRLSRRRADAVSAALVEAGVPAAQIDIVNRGEAILPVPTRDERAERRNRVVTVAALKARQVRRENSVPGCHG